MGTADELVPLLKKLRMSGVLDTLELRIRQAIDDNVSHSEFLVRLFTDEVERREAKQLDLRIRKAHFEHAKTLDDFDFVFNPGVPRARIIDLATCGFVAKHENILFLGPTGVGKSHLAQALGHRVACLGHSVLFVSSHRVFSDLRSARADGTLEKRMLRYTNPDVLILDDLGLRPLQHTDPIDLYDLIRARYERGATVITSNRAVDELHGLFGDPLLASAAMDRLLHHAHVIDLPGRSFRAHGKTPEVTPPV